MVFGAGAGGRGFGLALLVLLRGVYGGRRVGGGGDILVDGDNVGRVGARGGWDLCLFEFDLFLEAVVVADLLRLTRLLKHTNYRVNELQAIFEFQVQLRNFDDFNNSTYV